MRWLTWMALRELWSWRWRSVLSLLALALSLGLIVATGSIGGLMQASVATPAPLLGRPADLWISSAYDVDYDLPASLAARVTNVPGVAEVQPALRRPVRVQIPSATDVPSTLRAGPSATDVPSTLRAGPSATDVPPALTTGPRADTLALLGVEPAPYFAFHDLTLAAGVLPSAEAPGLVALAPWAFVQGLDLGQPVTVTALSGDVGLPVVGLVEVKSLAAAQQGLVLYAPLDTVADLFGLRDAVTVLEVRLTSGAPHRRVRADLEQALGPAYAVSGASQPTQGVQLWQRLVLGALIFVDGLTLAGSVGLVYAVFASAARARRRQIGLLRVVGAVRRQVLALVVTEATLLGVVGSGAGLIVGLAFAWGGTGLIVERTAPSTLGAPGPVVPPVPLGSVLLAVALGVLSSLAGAIGPAMRAARQPPLAALHTLPPPQPRRRACGVRLWQALLPALRLPTPAWVGPRAQARGGRGTVAARLFPAEARLAAANLARERGRGALIVGTLALILAMALGNVGVLSLLGEELTTTFGRLTGGDYLVLPGLTTISLRELAGQDTSDVPPLNPGLLAALEQLEDQAWLMGGTTADIEPLQVFPGQPTLLLDIEGYARMGSFRFQAGDWPTALEAFHRGPAVLLTPVVARRLHARLSDRVRLDTPHGPVDFSVAGIGDSEFTTCVLDLADGATYFGVNEVNAVEVQVRPGADAEAVRRALLDAVQAHGGTLLSLGQAVGQLRAVFRQARLSIGLLIGITGLVAGLGVVNAVLASVTERRREIGLLRAAGATRAQVNRMILAEMATLGTRSALIGTALGWAVTLLFLAVARATLGLSGGGAPSVTAWLPLFVASGAGLAIWPLLAMLGGLGPALYAARLPVIQALYETTPH
jgi:putative ABC transport system permease protein